MIEAAVLEEPKLRGRPRSVEAEAAILKATLQLLERRPLRKVTADAIARRAGVSKATIYKWWPNKSLTVRPELRFDHAYEATPYNNGTRRSQLVFGCDVIQHF